MERGSHHWMDQDRADIRHIRRGHIRRVHIHRKVHNQDRHQNRHIHNYHIRSHNRTAFWHQLFLQDLNILRNN